MTTSGQLYREFLKTLDVNKTHTQKCLISRDFTSFKMY